MVLRQRPEPEAFAAAFLAGQPAAEPLATPEQQADAEAALERLAADEVALDQEIAVARAALDDEIGGFLRPEEPLAGALPQSDCWALANAATGRDAMLASWEVVGRVTPVDGDGKPIDAWFDPDDGVLDLGLCRLSDPVTRQPPITRSGDRSAVGPTDCGAITDAGIFSLQFNAGDNFPQCLSDAAIYAGSNQGNPLGVTAEDYAVQNQRYSAMFTLPPLSVSVFKAE
jgi:hypothetical protein